MKAMILAAGRGQRMRPLTDTLPKPLLEVGGKALIVYHLEALAAAGFDEVVINHAWLGAQIENALGDGERFGLRIRYSAEAQALETAGGIRHALPWLGKEAFVLVNGDVFCAPDWIQHLLALPPPDGERCLAHILLVANPAHHPQGDFYQSDDGRLLTAAAATAHARTYAGIGLYHPALFAELEDGVPAALAPLLRTAIAEQKLAASFYRGAWHDVGTVERLAAVRALFA